MSLSRMEACEAAAPFTLLGLLLRRRDDGCAAAPLHFLRDYLARATNALLWLALISVTLLLARRLARLARLWSLARHLPGPPRPSLFRRHHLAAASPNPTGYLSRMHAEYGPVVRLWLGPTQLLVSVTDTAMVKEVLDRAEDRLPLMGKAFQLAFRRSSLFVSSFEKVQKRRESLALHLNGKLLEGTNTIPLKVVECVMGRVSSVMSKGILDCRLVSQHMAFYTLGATLFGDAFLDWPNAILYEELLTRIAKEGCFWASYNIPPFWRIGFWRHQLLCMRLKHLTHDIIRQCRNTYDLLGQSNHHPFNLIKDASLDLLHDLISGDLGWEEIDRLLISKEESCGNILGVMFHGCLTTAGLIGSILTRLVLYPEIQEKIYSEIIAVQKRACSSDSHEVQEMHLLLATVYESARLLPAGPLLQRCSLKHDLTFKTSMTIPAGALLVVPLQLIHMDSAHWGKDACQFNPYRFISKVAHERESSGRAEFDSKPIAATTGERDLPEDTTSTQTKVNSNTAFLPFGSGARACVGQKFAIFGVSALFASLLQTYEVKLQLGFDNDYPKPMMDECVLHLLPSPKIVFIRRNN